MGRVWSTGNGALVLCALLLAGCSAGGGGHAVARHDTGIHLSPVPAFTTSQIAVVLEDAWMDPAKCTFLWLRNGQEIPGATGPVLDPGPFHKGDRIEVEVGMPDTAGARRELKAEVTVSSSPPTVTHVTLSLNTGSGRPEVHALVECADPDGDHAAFTYRWFRNDTLVTSASDSLLPASGFTRGDRIVVEVVARDGESKSPPFRSDPLSLENHPPQFTSEPTAPGSADNEFRYQAAASDPDGDKLRFELVHGPSGMTVDPAGAVTWVLPPREQRHGSEPVTLRVSDGNGGEATQDFSVPLDPRPATR